MQRILQVGIFLLFWLHGGFSLVACARQGSEMCLTFETVTHGT